MKVQAINDAIEELLEEYDIPEFSKRAIITFDSNGLAALPSDYFRMIKLWNVDSSSVEESEYLYITEDNFDKKASTDAYYWTEDYIIADAARKLKVLPIASGTLQIRYIKTHTAVNSTDTADSGLAARWDKVVAASACKNLLDNAGQDKEAEKWAKNAMQWKINVWSALKGRGGFKEGSRVKSRYERISLLNR